MKNNSFLIGIIGALIGGFVVWLLTVCLGNGMFGHWRMMGSYLGNDLNKSGFSSMMGNIDAHFIEQMIPHHEGAIDMARLALEKSTRPEIKELSNNIITSQSAEITQMKDWYRDWFDKDVPQNSGEGMGMMGGGMMGSHADVDELEQSKDFDKAFIEIMIVHHQTAVMMANMLTTGTDRTEMKNLAQNIIDTQTEEINQMRDWYQNWGY